MTEQCPKCRAEWSHTDKCGVWFDCGSVDSGDYFSQMFDCRIRELTKENIGLKKLLSRVAPVEGFPPHTTTQEHKVQYLQIMAKALLFDEPDWPLGEQVKTDDPNGLR